MCYVDEPDERGLVQMLDHLRSEYAANGALVKRLEVAECVAVMNFVALRATTVHHPLVGIDADGSDPAGRERI